MRLFLTILSMSCIAASSLLAQEGYWLDAVEVAGENAQKSSSAQDYFKIEAGVYTINPQKDTILCTPQGNKLYIPAYSFVGEQQGETITEPVVLHWKECTDWESIYKAKLSTQTLTGEWLETGGMHHLSATTQSDQSPVALRQHTELLLELSAPTDMDMFAYYGEEQPNGRVDWLVDSLSHTAPPVIVAASPAFLFSNRTLRNDSLAYIPSTGVDLPFYKFLFSRYKIPKAQLLRLEGQTWVAKASFDCKGNQIGYEMCQGTGDTYDACQTFLEVTQHTGIQRNSQVSGRPFYFMALPFEVYAAQIAKRENNAFWEQVKTAQSIKQNRRGSFWIGRMGWINIDMEFVQPDLRTKKTLSVPAPLLAADESLDIRLVFTNERTVIAPSNITDGYILFDRVPFNTPFTIVSTIQSAKSVKMAQLPFEINAKNTVSPALDYQPQWSAEQLKAQVSLVGFPSGSDGM